MKNRREPRTLPQWRVRNADRGSQCNFITRPEIYRVALQIRSIVSPRASSRGDSEVVIKKHNTPPGLDYEPITGVHSNISFGIVQASSKGGATHTASSTIFRRLFPVAKPEDASDWSNPTCFRHDVLLPSGAPDEWRTPQSLAAAYDDQGFSLRDIAVVLTLRFPEVEVVPQTLKIHQAWESARAFTMERLVRAFGVAAVCVMHVPARAGRPGVPHTHILIPAREILPSGFAKFAKPLATDEGREVVDQAWTEWLECEND